ncbi:MAG: nucleoside 2-deoxyribosyltransferase [Syntrophothermus sp.]|uniref:nucleoside 2-deoxyribosyltransferase domain-containing protein n=1 Tax=Syntrophothermus sp. TaxID=2736299 RepID=UPI00257BFE62|nr:nucleoside 2-deoxyribosyltransferase domain-containing protein [Syntrophothermus sp.]NSW84091.1 nucleoside 2-deoxyribosyltransferase [Syntrophothermus sp.]
MSKVYLAGGIDGLSREQATCWRQRATEVLQNKGFEVIDPTHGRDMEMVYDPREVVGSAFANVDSADILLVEMNTPGHAYIGTAIEIRRAWEQGKPIICWGTANRSSYFLRYHATEISETLEEAIDRVVAWAMAEELALGGEL